MLLVNICALFLWKTLFREGRRKLYRMWVDKKSEFYNISMKSWLESNNIEIHSRNNKEKFAVAQRFIKTLKNKSYKYVNSILKNLYIGKIDNVVDKYNNICHSTIKMESYNDKDRNEIMIRILTISLLIMWYYQNIKTLLQYVILQIEGNFVIEKIKNTIPWTNVIKDRNSEEIVGTF